MDYIEHLDAVSGEKRETLEEMTKRIVEQNRIIEHGTSAEKRVLIARETIAVAKTIQVTQSVWLEMPRDVVLPLRGDTDRVNALTMQRLLAEDKLLANCHACAIGTAAVAACRLFDGFNPIVYSIGLAAGMASVQLGSGIEQLLAQYFDDLQIKMIEVAFELGHGCFQADNVAEDGECIHLDHFLEQEVLEECGHCGHTHYHTEQLKCEGCDDDEYNEYEKVTPSWFLNAKEFGEGYDEPKDRLIAIMENIIFNGGEFDPQKEA